MIERIRDTDIFSQSQRSCARARRVKNIFSQGKICAQTWNRLNTPCLCRMSHMHFRIGCWTVSASDFLLQRSFFQWPAFLVLLRGGFIWKKPLKVVHKGCCLTKQWEVMGLSCWCPCAFVWVGGGGYGNESAGFGSSEMVHHSLTGKKAKSSQRYTKQPTTFSQHWTMEEGSGERTCMVYAHFATLHGTLQGQFREIWALKCDTWIGDYTARSERQDAQERALDINGGTGGMPVQCPLHVKSAVQTRRRFRKGGHTTF